MQRVILEVSLGTMQGTRRILAPGETLRVGRREKADLVVPDDQLSAPHFEIAWDGEKCLLKDLRSQKGTFVGGQKVKSAELSNASWIRAGGSDFFLFFEEATPPPVDREVELLDAEEEDVDKATAEWLRDNKDRRKAALSLQKGRASAALDALRRETGPLYAVLDNARSDRILTLLQESVEDYRSLYEGTGGDALAHVAPYLVSLPPGSRLLERLVTEGWGRRWGSFFTCARPFKEVRRHLRRFLMVADADTRQRYYFRFYDPGVLRSFFPAATVRQTFELFGPIESFIVEGERGEVCRFDAPKGEVG